MGDNRGGAYHENPKAYHENPKAYHENPKAYHENPKRGEGGLRLLILLDTVLSCPSYRPALAPSRACRSSEKTERINYPSEGRIPKTPA